MKLPHEILQSIIDSEKLSIRKSIKGDTYFAVLNIIRRFDALTFFYPDDDVKDPAQLEQIKSFLNYGWPIALKPFYSELDFGKILPFIETNQADIEWADSAIFYSGKLGYCQQVIDFQKAKLVEIINPSPDEFGFKYFNRHVGLEYFERVSADFFRENIVEKVIAEKRQKKNFNKDRIKDQLRSVIQNPFGKFISYHTTNDIDEYYNQEGHYHILRLQGYDNFDINDKFGSIEYWKYVDIIELIMGVAQVHLDACIELIKKNPQVDIHNIISYMWFKDKIIKTYADYLDVPNSEIEQILSCITLSKDNYEYYLNYPSVPAPMLFQISENQLVRSVAGCLGNPMRLLNSELKRKYKRDYDIAVTKREDRFRKELFSLFPQQRIVKIPNEINISFNGIKTDIDAILYDTDTKTLGLFQLKWQDPFAHSMQERFSRISNLFPKANEWIEKMRAWTQQNDAKSILNALQITKYSQDAKEVENICVFVISRNHVHFTGVALDDTVAWGSWYQIIESKARVAVTFDDPIREMFVKLKMFDPTERMNREQTPSRRHVDIRFNKYRVYDYE